MSGSGQTEGQAGTEQQPAAQVQQGSSVVQDLQQGTPLNYIKFTVAAFVAVLVGLVVTNFLVDALAEPSSGGLPGVYTGTGGFGGSAGVIVTFQTSSFVFLGPVIGIVAGVLAGQDIENRIQAFLSPGIGTAVGFAVSYVLLFGAVDQQIPGSLGSLDAIGFVALALSIGVLAGLVGFAANQYDEML